MATKLQREQGGARGQRERERESEQSDGAMERMEIFRKSQI
jgi:hypothetical protein